MRTRNKKGGGVMKRVIILVSMVLFLFTTSAFSGEKKIDIGALIPMTGQGASYGKIFKNAIDLAVEEVNSSGELKGYKLVVHYEDHQAKPDVAVNAFNSLLARYNPPVILSSYTSISLAVSKLADRHKVLVINAGGQGNVLAGASKYLINTIPLVGLEVEILAKYLVQKRNLKTAGILYVNDEGGRSAYNAFVKFYREAGGKILIAESSKLGDTNFRSQLVKIKSKNPDVLYIATYGKDTAIIIKQARELNLKCLITANSWSLIPDVFNEPSSEGVLVTSVSVKPSSDLARKYKEKYGKEIQSVYPISFYNAVKVVEQSLAYIIKKGWKINGESFEKAVREIRVFKGASGTFEIREDGTVTFPVDINVIEKGKKRFIETFKL